MCTKILVIGFGFMGQTHAGNLLKNPLAELAGIVDPFDPAERLASIKGNKNTVTITPQDVTNIPHYKTLEEALAKSSASGAIVALPTKLHHSAVKACLNAGLHVFVEKPFAISLKECQDMVACAKEKDLCLAVGYVVRYMKEYTLLRETILSGRLGKLTCLKLSRITGIPDWGNWKDPEFIRASGGSLFDLVSHDLDFARFCAGEPLQIESVPDLGKNHFAMISTVLRYSDFNVAVEGGFVTPSTYPFQRSFTAYFEKGTLQTSDKEGILMEYTPEGIREIPFAEEDPYYKEVDCFLHALQSGDTSSICLGSDAMHSIECCTAIAKQIAYPMPDSI